MDKEWFGLLGELEGLSIELEEARNLFQLYSEFTENEEKSLEKAMQDPCIVACYLARLPLSTSLIDTIRTNINSISSRLIELSDVCYKKWNAEVAKQ